MTTNAWAERARATWIMVVAAGVGLVLWSASQWPALAYVNVPDWAIFVALASATVLVFRRPVDLHPDWRFNASSAPGVALALLAPMAPAILIAAAMASVAQAVTLRRWRTVLHGAAQWTITFGATSGTVELARRQGLPELACIAAGTITYFLVGTTCVAAIRSAQRGSGIGGTWIDVARAQGIGEWGLLSAGALIAVLLRIEPAAVPIAFPLLWFSWTMVQSTAERGRMNSRLKEALDRERQFVADAAHELRTPAAALCVQIDVMRREIAQWSRSPGIDASASVITGISGQLDDAARQTARMSYLVANLLTIARADAGAPMVSLPVDLEEVLLATYREMRPLAGKVRFELRLDEQAAHPPVISGDSERLRQLFVNLVSNAQRYTPDGGRVDLRCIVVGAHVAVEVVDTGTGIAAEDLPHIFDRFYRAGAAPAREMVSTGGVGLGLAIARLVAEAHGGTIAVTTGPGEGSTFTVTLPLASPAAPVMRP